MEYAEHLYTDPSLWRVTLEYLGACGKEGRAMVAEIIMRVPIDISIPSSLSEQGGTPRTPHEKAKEVQSDLDMIFMDGDVNTGRDDLEKKAWSEWEDKVLKIIDVCKDYGLDDVLASVCRVSLFWEVVVGFIAIMTRLMIIFQSQYHSHSFEEGSMDALSNTQSWLETVVELDA